MLLLPEIKETNVYEAIFLVTKAAMQNFSSKLFVLSCRMYSEYIVVSLVGFLINLTARDIFSNFVCLLL